MTIAPGSDSGEPVLLVHRPRRTNQLAALALLGVAGLVLVAAGQYAAGASSIVFGLVGGAALAHVWSKRSTLLLERDGFTVTSATGQVRTRSWVDCSTFRPVGIGSSRRGGVLYTLDPRVSGTLNTVQRGLTGFDESISAGFGGLSTAQLCELMNARRNAAIDRPAR